MCAADTARYTMPSVKKTYSLRYAVQVLSDNRLSFLEALFSSREKWLLSVLSTVYSEIHFLDGVNSDPRTKAIWSQTLDSETCAALCRHPGRND